MHKLRLYRQIPVLLAGCTLFANGLLLWGCAQIPEKLMTSEVAARYPEVVVEVQCDDPKKLALLPVELSHTEKSDIPIWGDLKGAVNGMKLWRVQVYRVYQTGKPPIPPIATSTGGTGYSNAWLRIDDQRRAELKDLPLEVVLRADLDVCNCDDPESESAKHGEGRSILFLLHRIPEAS